MNIGRVLTLEQWELMNPNLTPTQLTEKFESYTNELLDIYCPTKRITISRYMKRDLL